MLRRSNKKPEAPAELTCLEGKVPLCYLILKLEEKNGRHYAEGRGFEYKDI